MMNSGQQTTQVSSLASQPQQITNEPQEMQQGRTTQCHTGRQVMTIPQHVQKKSSQSPQGPKDQQTLPHQAPDVPPIPLQMLRPMPAPEQTRQVIQHVLQQRPQEVCTSQQTSQMSQQEKQQMKTVCQKMQQAKTMQHQILVATVSKKVHASTGRSTPAPVMAAPQQMLGETPVREHVPETHKTQWTAPLQQMQVKTQQHQKQQEMTELLNREGSTPAPVMVAPQQVLGETPVRQHVSETNKRQWTATLQQMQVKTQQHQKQQKMTELLNREGSTPAPVMVAPQQVLGETPVRQHVSETNKRQWTATLQQMQVKTQQHQKQQEMTELLHRERSTPAPVMAASQEVLGQTPVRQHVSETSKTQWTATLQQMQLKTQQHQKQQKMIELLNRERSTPAPVMAAPQQVLGETPLRQHVSETHRKQGITTLQQMQVKTQQHQKQQEMTELLHRERSTPAPVMAASQEVLGQTPVRQHVSETSKTQWTATLQQMQLKTQQHQKQQKMIELLNRERSTPAPVMAAPQQVLGETPLTQHVSETHRKQGITTLQQMQVKTQQHQKQQEMTELLHRERSTPAPVMAAPQQVLGETPLRQHVSETHRKQGITTLQQMQVKTQQHQKQQEMTELLHRERSTPAPVMAASQEVLGQTPVRQHVSETSKTQWTATLQQMQLKTQQHQKQQKMIELLNRERSTPAPVMAAPQQVLGETPLRQHVSETHRKQGITTLQQMQVKTQQHQKQQEMTELLHRERSTPAPVIAAPRQVLAGTLLRQHVLETLRRQGKTTLQQMQVKTQQHQKQQNMTELLHRERPTAAPVMAAPQQSLGETPVRQHVSETKQTQRPTTLEQMQVKIQQHQKFQEMAELLHREGVSPLKLVAVVTSQPTQQRALHVFLIPKHALQPTPTQQKAKVGMKASQEKPKMTTPLQQNPQVHPTSSKMHILQRLHKELTAFLQEVEFSSVLELLSLAPMLFPKPPSKGSFGNIASGSDNIKKRNDGIQNQPTDKTNLHKPTGETTQENQEQPSKILSDFHKNLISSLEIEEETENFHDLGCISTPLPANDVLETLQDLEKCDLETCESDSVPSSATKIKENKYSRRLKNANSDSGMRKTSKITPLTGSYCRIRHSLLLRKHQSAQNKQTCGGGCRPPPIGKYSITPKEGVIMYLSPTVFHVPAQRFVQRISVERHSREATVQFDPLTIFCKLQNPSEEPVTQGKSNVINMTITPVLEIVQHLSQQANPKVLKAHLYVFSALLQQLHRRNRAATLYFNNIVADHLRHSELQNADQSVGVGNSQEQTDVGNDIIREQAGSNIATSEVPLNIGPTDESTGFQKGLLQDLPMGLHNINNTHEQNQSNNEMPKEETASHHIPVAGSLLEAVMRFCVVSPHNCRGFTDRFHLQMLLKTVKVIMKCNSSLNKKNGSGTSFQTTSQTQQQHHTKLKKPKFGIPYLKNLKQKVKHSNTAKEKQKNLKCRYVTCKPHLPVTSVSENSYKVIPYMTVSNTRNESSLSRPGRIPTQSTQEGTQQNVSLAEQHKCDNSMKCSSLVSGDVSREKHITVEELCNIFCAGEDTIISCGDCDPNSKKAHNPEMSQTPKRAAGSKKDGSSEVFSQESENKPESGVLFLLMPADNRFFVIWKMLLESTDEGKIEAKYYEGDKDGFIEYMRTTTEAPQHGSRSRSDTEHAKPQYEEVDQQMTSTRLTSIAAPCCECRACTDSDEGGSTQAVSSAAMVIDSFEVLMEALTLDDPLEAIHCKKEHAAEVLRKCKDTGPGDTGKGNTKKAPQRKQ